MFGGAQAGRKVIALLTDFGNGSVYVGAMKGVIASIAPTATIIDITHGVAPESVEEASFLLAATYRHFPAGTTFVAVVDPGVGTAREIVLLEAAGGRLFLAPDNGLLTGVLAREERGPEPPAARWVRERRHFLPEVSATFHGRDIFAPVAARLATGRIEPADVGPEAPLERLARLPPIGGGKIVHVDPFGNLVTDIEVPEGKRPARVRVSGHNVEGGARTYGEAEPRAPFAYVGSFGTVEVGLPMGSAAVALGAARGLSVQVTFTEA